MPDPKPLVSPSTIVQDNNDLLDADPFSPVDFAQQQNREIQREQEAQAQRVQAGEINVEVPGGAPPQQQPFRLPTEPTEVRTGQQLTEAVDQRLGVEPPQQQPQPVPPGDPTAPPPQPDIQLGTTDLQLGEVTTGPRLLGGLSTFAQELEGLARWGVPPIQTISPREAATQMSESQRQVLDAVSIEVERAANRWQAADSWRDVDGLEAGIAQEIREQIIRGEYVPAPEGTAPVPRQFDVTTQRELGEVVGQGIFGANPSEEFNPQQLQFGEFGRGIIPGLIYAWDNLTNPFIAAPIEMEANAVQTVRGLNSPDREIRLQARERARQLFTDAMETDSLTRRWMFNSLAPEDVEGLIEDLSPANSVFRADIGRQGIHVLKGLARRERQPQINEQLRQGWTQGREFGFHSNNSQEFASSLWRDPEEEENDERLFQEAITALGYGPGEFEEEPWYVRGYHRLFARGNNKDWIRRVSQGMVAEIFLDVDTIAGAPASIANIAQAGVRQSDTAARNILSAQLQHTVQVDDISRQLLRPENAQVVEALPARPINMLNQAIETGAVTPIDATRYTPTPLPAGLRPPAVPSPLEAAQAPPPVLRRTRTEPPSPTLGRIPEDVDLTPGITEGRRERLLTETGEPSPIPPQIVDPLSVGDINSMGLGELRSYVVRSGLAEGPLVSFQRMSTSTLRKRLRELFDTPATIEPPPIPFERSGVLPPPPRPGVEAPRLTASQARRAQLDEDLPLRLELDPTFQNRNQEFIQDVDADEMFEQALRDLRVPEEVKRAPIAEEAVEEVTEEVAPRVDPIEELTTRELDLTSRMQSETDPALRGQMREELEEVQGEIDRLLDERDAAEELRLQGEAPSEPAQVQTPSEEITEVTPDIPVSNTQKVFDAAFEIAGGQANVRIRIGDLVRKTGLETEEVAEALTEMGDAGEVLLLRFDNPQEIKPDDIQIPVGSDERGLAYFSGYGSRGRADLPTEPLEVRPPEIDPWEQMVRDLDKEAPPLPASTMEPEADVVNPQFRSFSERKELEQFVGNAQVETLSDSGYVRFIEETGETKISAPIGDRIGDIEGRGAVQKTSTGPVETREMVTRSDEPEIMRVDNDSATTQEFRQKVDEVAADAEVKIQNPETRNEGIIQREALRDRLESPRNAVEERALDEAMPSTVKPTGRELREQHISEIKARNAAHTRAMREAHDAGRLNDVLLDINKAMDSLGTSIQDANKVANVPPAAAKPVIRKSINLAMREARIKDFDSLRGLIIHSSNPNNNSTYKVIGSAADGTRLKVMNMDTERISLLAPETKLGPVTFDINDPVARRVFTGVPTKVTQPSGIYLVPSNLPAGKEYTPFGIGNTISYDPKVAEAQAITGGGDIAMSSVSGNYIKADVQIPAAVKADLVSDDLYRSVTEGMSDNARRAFTREVRRYLAESKTVRDAFNLPAHMKSMASGSPRYQEWLAQFPNELGHRFESRGYDGVIDGANIYTYRGTEGVTPVAVRAPQTPANANTAAHAKAVLADNAASATNNDVLTKAANRAKLQDAAQQKHLVSEALTDVERRQADALKDFHEAQSKLDDDFEEMFKEVDFDERSTLQQELQDMNDDLWNIDDCITDFLGD